MTDSSNKTRSTTPAYSPWDHPYEVWTVDDLKICEFNSNSNGQTGLMNTRSFEVVKIKQISHVPNNTIHFILVHVDRKNK